MPAKVWPFWLATGLILTGYPVLSFVYWPAVARAGLLPPDGDTIVIPMFASIGVAVVASPPIIVLAWLCLRRYNPATSLLAWRRDRPIRSAIATLGFGGPALLFVVAICTDAASALLWQEHLWSAYFGLWVWWLLALRAAAIEQVDARD